MGTGAALKGNGENADDNTEQEPRKTEKNGLPESEGTAWLPDPIATRSSLAAFRVRYLTSTPKRPRSGSIPSMPLSTSAVGSEPGI